MSEPVETFLGWTGLGFGVLLAYGAYKNVPVLGPTGLLTTSLTTGKVPTVPGKGVIGPGKAPRKPKSYNPLTGTGTGIPGANPINVIGPHSSAWTWAENNVGAPIRHWLFGSPKKVTTGTPVGGAGDWTSQPITGAGAGW